MQILRDHRAVQAAIASWPDAGMGQLLTERLALSKEYDVDLSELLMVIRIEPGDTVEALDREFDGGFLINHASGTRFGEPSFKPCFELLEEHSTFYDMVFCQGDAGFGVEVIVPKSDGIDPRLLTLCAQFAIEAPPFSS
jgi:hypothetical protein